MSETIKTIRATASPSSFSLISEWQCDEVGIGTNKTYEFLPDMPTWANQMVEFTFFVPSGASIVSAKVYADLTTVDTGYSILTANGSAFSREEDGSYSAPVKLRSGVTSLSVGINFKANGRREDTNPGQSILSFSNVYLEIVYKESLPVSAEEVVKGFSIPPQSCCIYNPSNGKVYMFDGVIQIQHQASLKIEEEPDATKHSYTNNAYNEPDKVTLNIVMSDVYSGGGSIEGNPSESSAQSKALKAAKSGGVSIADSRSAKAYAILKALKESRTYLSIITPQYVYTEMLISSIVANQEENAPYSWSGQIIFQHKYAAKPAAKSSGGNSSPAKTGSSVPPSAAGVSALNTAKLTPVPNSSTPQPSPAKARATSGAKVSLKA